MTIDTIEERNQWLALGRELRILTAKQDQALSLWANGYGYSRVAYMLGVTRETARSRIQRGLVRVELAVRSAA